MKVIVFSAAAAICVTLAFEPVSAQPGSGLYFGDDFSEWAFDGECDDPRFEGEGMASVLLDEDARRDATDCRNLFEAGAIFQRAGTWLTRGAIDFGDDTGDWALDGECDDPRFRGRGMASVLLAEDKGRDASDCSALFSDGAIELIG